jgi:hypothetical protein
LRERSGIGFGFENAAELAVLAELEGPQWRYHSRMNRTTVFLLLSSALLFAQRATPAHPAFND